MKEQFSKLSERNRELMIINGKSLRQRIHDDKIEIDAGRSNIKMNNTYYDELRVIYEDDTSVVKRLVSTSSISSQCEAFDFNVKNFFQCEKFDFNVKPFLSK